jgi:Spy/CpxP family protein refolding chaperone
MNKASGKQAASLAWVALSLLLLILFSARVQAQSTDAAQQNEGERRAKQQREALRDPLRALNLTPDQLQQIRAIREQSKDEWRVARQRVAEAHRALDEAIYSDNVNEALVEERSREVGIAQAAVARLRALTELKIRRVLTPEQLNTLRFMRQQAREAEGNGKVENSFGQRPRRRDGLGQGDSGPLQRGRRP